MELLIHALEVLVDLLWDVCADGARAAERSCGDPVTAYAYEQLALRLARLVANHDPAAPEGREITPHPPA